MKPRRSKTISWGSLVGCVVLVATVWLLNGRPGLQDSDRSHLPHPAANQLTAADTTASSRTIARAESPTLAELSALADLSGSVASSTFNDTNIKYPAVSSSAIATEFRDPFYAFIIGIAESDSLGRWTEHDLQAYLTRNYQQSKLPLEYFHSLERYAVDGATSEYRRGARVHRAWRLTLKEPLNYPMPYSVLGYDLGSLFIAQELVFSEWRLGSRNVHAPEDGKISVIPVTDLLVLRLDLGWIVMDVDGWVDKLLGGKLDDSWTQGFAICRQDGEIRGLALSLNRDLRPLCGEIDFATNEVTAQGGPLARGVAVYVRPWVTSAESSSDRTWQFER
jgi:hypothetical protein